ncbi:MAG TPA: M56 family metallopeptidase, partial [Patescibacteria group bacterium]|nr:M56 family metallopeptidase [Patescibacteria group bacterium]
SPEFLSPFCGGFFYPRIFVPLNTVRTCNDRELTTMLLHEKQHLESFDPFKTLVLRFVTLFLFAFPLFGHLEEKYLLASEIEADARASGSFRFRDSLLRAMRKMYAPHPSSPVVSGMASAMDMRIEHLLLPIEFPRLRLAPKEIILSIILSLAVCFAFAGSFHLRHALSVEVVEFNDGQMTRLKWESVSLFDAPHLYLTPITQSTNVTSCQGEAMNYTPL